MVTKTTSARMIAVAMLVSVGMVVSGCANRSRSVDTVSSSYSKPTLNADGLRNGLVSAATSGDVSKIKDMLRQGADVNSKDAIGNTALYWASWMGYKDAVETLVAAGANVNANIPNGKTALHVASGSGRTGVVSVLLANGADVNASDQHGRTPLHEASSGNHSATVEVLLKYGPNVNVRDDAGKLPADGAWASFDDGKKIKAMIQAAALGSPTPKVSPASPVVPAAASVAPLNPDRFKGRSRPQAIALVIGIEGYESAPAAEFGENDARRFSEYAVNALGVPKDRIKVLLGSGARRLDIEKALHNWVSPLVAKGRSEVFIFFSGHGLASEDGSDLFLLPYDGDHTLLSRSGIRRKEVIDTVMGAGAASATLFLDTCYSGGTRGKDTLIASARPVLLAAKETGTPTGVTILAAAANNQLSSSYPAARHGLFSYWLMKGLEGEAAAGGRTITASKLKAYLAEKVPSEAAKLGRVQTPQLIGDGDRVVASW